MPKTHQFIAVNQTISTVAKQLSDLTFTAAQIAGAVGLRVTTDQPMRFRTDGGTPTATYGHLIPANDTRDIVNNPAGIRFIRGGGTDCLATIELETFEEV